MTKGYAKIPHIVFQVDMDIQEKYMLIFLLDCENKFNKQGEWFGITDDDFIKVGFGSCKSRWRKYRNDLITKGLIEYRKGSNGKKSQYRITDNIEEKLMQYIGTLIIENNEVVDVVYKEEGNKPSTEIKVTKGDTNRKDEWTHAIITEDPKWGSSRYQIFNKYWREFYGDRDKARAVVNTVLQENKIRITL